MGHDGIPFLFLLFKRSSRIWNKCSPYSSFLNLTKRLVELSFKIGLKFFVFDVFSISESLF